MSAIARHAKPSCGHHRLVECPLTREDWNVVFLAYLGFLQTCRLVAEQAHSRDALAREFGEPHPLNPYRDGEGRSLDERPTP